METISLDTVEMMAGVSRRTLWRRVTDGALTSGKKDARGRATLVLEEVLGLAEENLGMTFNAENVQVLLQAEAGDAEAQTDLGAMLYVESLKGAAAAGDAALYWLQQAAGQNNADAMHWLGTVSAAKRTEQGDSEAMMWISKAAAHGHVIAEQQLSALLDAAVPDREDQNLASDQ